MSKEDVEQIEVKEDKLDIIYRHVGYKKRNLYNKPSKESMIYKGISKYATKFRFLSDLHLSLMEKAIIQSPAFQRTSQKAMNTNRAGTVIATDDEVGLKDKFKDTESLIQTRQTHMVEVANIAEIISKGIGTNYSLSRIMAIAHDIGHTPYGHVGERILSSCARLKNCGYIIHPAMGADVLEREKVIKNGMDTIKQAYPDLDKEESDEIRQLQRYIMDGILCHNGEGTVGKIIPQKKSKKTMRNQLRRSFTQKGYDKKLLPATIEGAIIRYADIIAYTRSDLVDGFRQKDENGKKIMKEFNDDYLALIGTIFARENNFNKMLTLEQSFLTELYGLSQRIKKLDKKSKTKEDGIEIQRTKKEIEFIHAKYEEFCKLKVQYAKEFIKKIPKGERKTKIPEIIQNVFIKDLIETSRDNNGITMSPLMRTTFFALRELNAKYIIPYTARGYEEDLPYATNELVDMFTNGLIKSGIAYDAIPKKDRIKYNIPEKKGYSREMDSIAADPKFNMSGINFEIKMFHYFDNLKKFNKRKLNEIYKNAFNALKDITKHDILIALGKEKYDGELKETYEKQKIEPIREKIKVMGDYAQTKEGKKELFNLLLQDREKEIERIVASKMAIEYIAGMTDNTLMAILLNRNIISKKTLIKKYARPSKEMKTKDAAIKALQKSFRSDTYKGMILPDSQEELMELQERGL